MSQVEWFWHWKTGKGIIVIPLTIFLPFIFGVDGVFIAEPVSNLLGGAACFLTMYFTVYRKLGK